MLRKLLKYDLKSGLRTFIFLWLGILAGAGINYLTTSMGDEDSWWWILMGAFSMIPLIFAMAGAMVYPYVYGAIRFHKGLLGREGYLMFTLPSTPWKLLTSKLITAVLFAIVTMIVAMVGLATTIGGFLAPLGGVGFGLSDIFGLEGFDGYAVATILDYLLSLITGFLQIYLACCLGHLCRSKRVLWAVLFYVALGLGTSMISSLLQFITMAQSENGLGEMMESMLYLDIPFRLGLGILYFYLSERILRTRLNLE